MIQIVCQKQETVVLENGRRGHHGVRQESADPSGEDRSGR
jgi:hypothetical protein